MLAVVCDGDAAAARGGGGVVGQGVLGGVTVIRRGEHHGRLIRLCVLVVQVDHAPAAVLGSGQTERRKRMRKRT